MPARYNDQRHHSADSFRNSGAFDHLCSSDRAEDSDGSLPGRLNPASSQDNINHARSGSTDSLDTPSIGSHSRQSSGSIDSMNTVTSTASTPFRKTSSTVAPSNPSHDPMQFVKHGRSNWSMEAAAKQRVIDQVVEVKKKQQFEGEEWQANLSSWRSKRLTKTSTYNRQDEAVAADDADAEEAKKRGTKTYKEIVEERKTRKPSLNFYPIEDDDFQATLAPKYESKPSVSSDEEDRSSMYVPPKPGQKSEDVDVTITQEPNTEGGFGFSIKGGKDQLCPIIIDKITPESAASKCNVCEGDEIVYVNNQCAEDQFRGSIMLIINQANRKGHLEMKLRRYENKKKTKVKLSDASHGRRSLSFEGKRALPGVGLGEYSHGIRRKSAGPELIGRRLVDIPLAESEELDEAATTPPVGIVAQRRASLQSSSSNKSFELKDIPPDLGDDDDDLFEELIKPEETEGEESVPGPPLPKEPEPRKPLLSNRFTKMPSIVDAQEKLKKEKKVVDVDDYESEDERLEREIMDRLEKEAEEEERENAEMEKRHDSILSDEDKTEPKRVSPMIHVPKPVTEKLEKQENICDEQNNVPKYTAAGFTMETDLNSQPDMPKKSTVTLNMNIKPSLSKQNSFDTTPAQSDSWRDNNNSDIHSGNVETKPVFESVGSMELNSSVLDYTDSTPMEDNKVDNVIRPNVVPVSFSEPPKAVFKEPPKPAPRVPSKPAPVIPVAEKEPAKLAPKVSSPRRPRSNKNYSFLKKFATEDASDYKPEEYKPSATTGSFLDKYVKDLDQEKEFDSLFDFDNTDDDAGQKTYTVYDRFLDHSPRPDIALTSKPKPYGGYLDATKPRPYPGFTSEGSGPSSRASSTADLSAKSETQSSLYTPSKPEPYGAKEPALNEDKTALVDSLDGSKSDDSRRNLEDTTAEKLDQDKKVPPLDISFGSEREEKGQGKSEKPAAKKLPWERGEFRKFGSLDSLKKESPRSNDNSLTGSDAKTQPWRSESPARQEREESTARWAEAASHTKPEFSSPNKLLDPPAEPSQWSDTGYTNPVSSSYEPKPMKSSGPSAQDVEATPQDYANGDSYKKMNKTYAPGYLEEEKRKREEWRREQERKKQELFAKGQILREGNNQEDINPQDVQRNDQLHKAIHNSELRKLNDLKNGSIPEWANFERPENDDDDEREMEEKARQEADEWERYRKEKERSRAEREKQEVLLRQKDEERRRIAEQAQKRHLEEKQRQQQLEEELRRKREADHERQRQLEEAEKLQRETEIDDWQRQQELELERLHEDRERDRLRREELQRQRPDMLPIQQRHQIQVSMEPKNYSQPHSQMSEGRPYDPGYLDGHMMSPDRYYGQAPTNGQSPQKPNARMPEKAPVQTKLSATGELLPVSPLIGRRDVRSPKTLRKGPITAHPITRDEIRDGNIPQPKRRTATSPSVQVRQPLGQSQSRGALPGSPQFLHRDDAKNVNRKSLGMSGDFTPEGSNVPQEHMSRERLTDLGAAPRAQKREDWVQPQQKKTPSEPVSKNVSRGHWLIEEAERRRQAEMNERDMQRQGMPSSQGTPQSYSPGQSHPRLMGDRMGGSLFYQAPGDRPHSMSRDMSCSQTMPDLRQPGDTYRKPPHLNNSDHYGPQAMSKSQSLSDFRHGLPQDYHDSGHPGYQTRHPQHHQPVRQEQPDPRSYAPSSQIRTAVPTGPAPAKPPRGAPVPGGASTAEPVIAVSGKHRCSHCMAELGQGAAMVIESLQLYYHTQCFRCCVCRTSLGTGQAGADVRVRGSRLHCQNCYSNDEGIKYSRV